MSRNNPKSLEIPHQWMKGNLQLASKCFVCSEFCGDEPRLVDFRCLWCQTSIHEECLSRLNPQSLCSFGPFRDLLLPPTAVIPTIEKSKWRPTMNKFIGGNPNNNASKYNNTRKFMLQIPDELKDDYHPLLIFVNPKSGGTEGRYLLRKFRELLNPIQVVDLSQEKPNLKLELFYDLSSFKILVCGGDGTVGW